jgi:hypothetical protein
MSMESIIDLIWTPELDEDINSPGMSIGVNANCGALCIHCRVRTRLPNRPYCIVCLPCC